MRLRPVIIGDNGATAHQLQPLAAPCSDRPLRSKGKRSVNHILNCRPAARDDCVGGAVCQIERSTGGGWWLRGRRAA